MSNKHYTELCLSVFVFGLKGIHSDYYKKLQFISFKAPNTSSILLFNMATF